MEMRGRKGKNGRSTNLASSARERSQFFSGAILGSGEEPRTQNSHLQRLVSVMRSISASLFYLRALHAVIFGVFFLSLVPDYNTAGRNLETGALSISVSLPSMKRWITFREKRTERALDPRSRVHHSLSNRWCRRNQHGTKQAWRRSGATHMLIGHNLNFS